MGTKDNRIMVLDTSNEKQFEIPTIHRPEDQEIVERQSQNCSGIHDISLNPAGDLLVSGAKTGNAAVIYSMPTMEPVLYLAGHKDTIFTMTWISDDVLITGCRDASMNVWNIREALTTLYSSEGATQIDQQQQRQQQQQQYIEIPSPHDDPKYVAIIKPVKTMRDHLIVNGAPDSKAKVRASKMHLYSQQLATLGTEGRVMLWDVNELKPRQCLELEQKQENVCLAMDNDFGLIAVGSQSHVTLLDPRLRPQQSIVKEFESEDLSWGVRSLAFNRQVLSVGNGAGRISFWDMRQQNYIETLKPMAIETHERNVIQPGLVKRGAESGKGWLRHDATYMEHFQNSLIRQAVYTLSYDSTGTRLFAAGGPLQLGLCGSYAAMWS